MMLADAPAVLRRPLFIEMIGPAGAGKTTLIKALCQKNEHMTIAPKPSYRLAKNLLFLGRNLPPLLPVFLQQRRHCQAFAGRELWWMIYLNGWHQRLGQQTLGNRGVYLIDHGPMYMLASLFEFSRGSTPSARFQKWWEQKFTQWSSFLHMLVWLDAPNVVLSTRINHRATEHPMKGESDQTSYEFLNQYRNSFERAILLAQAQNKALQVLHFFTDQTSVEQMTDAVLSQMHCDLQR